MIHRSKDTLPAALPEQIKIRDLTIVFDPKPSRLWPPPRPKAAYTHCATICIRSIGQVRFTNTESLEPEQLGEGAPKVSQQHHFESSLRSMIDQLTESETDRHREAIHEKVHVVGIEDYLTSHDWEGEFEPEEAFHHFIASLVNKFSSVFAHLSNPPASSSRTSQTSPLPASPVGMPPQPTDMAARRSRREGKTGTTPDEPEVRLRGIAQLISYPDVLRLVFLLSDTKTLGRCLRVSRGFFDKVGPVMYRYLELRHGPPPRFHHPLKDAGRPRTAVSSSTRSRTAMSQYQPVYDFKTRLLEHTQIAKWEPNATICAQFNDCELMMPNLRILQVDTRAHPGSCTFSYRKSCPLWRQFPAPKVVVVTHDFLWHRIHGPMPSRHSGYHLKKMVLKEKGNSPPLPMSVHQSLWNRQLSADHLVVLFIPKANETTVQFPRLSSDRRPPAQVAQQIFDLMRYLCIIATGTTTFVNAGFIHHDLVGLSEGTSTQAAQDHIEERVRKSITEHASAEKREEILGKVKFVGMKEYLQENDWEGELEPAEAERWLQ